MMLGSLLLILTVFAPLGMIAACLSRNVRARALDMLPFAALPGLVASVAAVSDSVVMLPAPLRLTLSLDVPGALLLGSSSLLWCVAGTFAASYMREKKSPTTFAIWWLLTLTGSQGVFIAADLVSFYLTFTVLSLSAYGLIAHDETPTAHHAAFVYVALAVLAEAFVLLAFTMLANGSPESNPLIRDAALLLPTSPWRSAIVILLVLGFGLKMGLVPLHVWLPLAHPAAPMPASAVLSGVVVNAGVIGLLRFIPIDGALSTWGTVIAAIGLVTVFYGAAVGLTQSHPKVVLAYSTVSQLGLVAAIFGAGLLAADARAASLVALYGMHHTMVKGALFLAVGIVAATGRQHAFWVRAVIAVLALSLTGLPLTSGALAKIAATDVLEPLVAIAFASSLAAVGSTLLMLHFVRIIAQETAPSAEAAAPRQELGAWLALAGASVVVTWAVYPHVTGAAAYETLGLASLWKLLWPIGLGAAISLWLRRAGSVLPHIPAGDLLSFGSRLVPPFQRFDDAVARTEQSLGQWAVAVMLLLALTLLFGRVALPGS